MRNKISGLRQSGCSLLVTLELGLPEIIMIIEGIDREIQAKRLEAVKLGHVVRIKTASIVALAA